VAFVFQDWSGATFSVSRFLTRESDESCVSFLDKWVLEYASCFIFDFLEKEKNPMWKSVRDCWCSVFPGARVYTFNVFVHGSLRFLSSFSLSSVNCFSETIYKISIRLLFYFLKPPTKWFAEVFEWCPKVTGIFFFGAPMGWLMQSVLYVNACACELRQVTGNIVWLRSMFGSSVRGFEVWGFSWTRMIERPKVSFLLMSGWCRSVSEQGAWVCNGKKIMSLASRCACRL